MVVYWHGTLPRTLLWTPESRLLSSLYGFTDFVKLRRQIGRSFQKAPV